LIGWDQYGPVDVHEEALDTRHNDNEETNQDQVDYEPNIRGDIDIDEDEEDNDGINSFLLLLN